MSLKRSPLKRSKPLRARPKPRSADPARDAWKTVRWGRCTVCGAIGFVVRHHVCYAQHLRREGREDLMWDLRNALDVGTEQTCSCHHDHHWAIRRIPLPLISDEAVAFTVDVLGELKAAAYFARFYAPELKEAA